MCGQCVFYKLLGFGEFGFGLLAGARRGFDFGGKLFLPCEVYRAGFVAWHINQYIFEVTRI